MMTDINYCWLSHNILGLAAFETNKENRDENSKNASTSLYDFYVFFSRCVNNNFRVMQINIWSTFALYLHPYTQYKSHIIFPRHGTTQKKLQACKNLSKNWHFIIIHLFFDFFQLFFLRLLFSLNTSSYIHINYARSLWR